jgi:hypothetical protein
MAHSDLRIIYIDDDNNVCIITPIDNCGKTIEQIKEQIVPSGKSADIISKDKIPNSPYFLDAYDYASQKFSLNMSKAKEIHKKKIRQARTPKLAELDIEFQKALETSADTSAIVAKKKALRDAPADSAITEASSEAELKSQWNTSILGDSPYS